MLKHSFTIFICLPYPPFRKKEREKVLSWTFCLLAVSENHCLSEVSDDGEAADDVVGDDLQEQGLLENEAVAEAELAHEPVPPVPAPPEAEHAAPVGAPVVCFEDDAEWNDFLYGHHSIDFGYFRFSMKRCSPQAPHSTLEALCPYDMRSIVSKCRKAVTVKERTAEHVELVLRALRHWCNRARVERRQRARKWPLHLDLVATPPLAVVVAGLYNDPPPAVFLSDQDLDAREERQAQAVQGAAAAAAPAENRAAAKPKGRAKAAAVAKQAAAKGQAHAKGQARAKAKQAPQPVPDALAPVRSSSSSSSSTSSSSSDSDSQ